MTKEQLQWAMYEAYATQLLDRIEAQEAEVAKLGTMAEQTRADAVTRAAADEKRIEALRHECERWKTAYSDHCALLDVIHASLGINKGDNVIGEIDRIHKARNGLLTQVQDLRAALEKEQELHAATALRLSTEAAKMVEQIEGERYAQTPKHPVKVGEWVRSIHGEVALVIKVGALRYEIFGPGLKGWKVWHFDYCEPCDPPAADHDTEAGKAAAESGLLLNGGLDVRKVTTDHDTEAGKAAAESAVKTEPVVEEIKVGDVVKVRSASGDNTAKSDIGKIGEVRELDSQDGTVFLSGGAGWVSRCDIRKVTT